MMQWREAGKGQIRDFSDEQQRGCAKKCKAHVQELHSASKMLKTCDDCCETGLSVWTLGDWVSQCICQLIIAGDFKDDCVDARMRGRRFLNHLPCSLA